VAARDVTAALPIGARIHRSGRRWGEDVIKGLLALCALVSVATTVGIVVALLEPALEFFGEINPIDYLTGTTWAPLFEPGSFGVVPLIVGTLSVTFWACHVAMPFGLGVEIFNALSAGLVIGVMLIPTVASLSEDAMTAVPQSLRDAAYGLGSSKLQVSTRVVVPAAISGIIASYVLAISRAVGETMVVVIAAGLQPNLTFDPVRAVETMTAFIASTGQGDVPTGSTEYKTIFAVGLTLFVATLVMNIVSIRLVRRYREVYE
jgi:phosphate transport system permease protein